MTFYSQEHMGQDQWVLEQLGPVRDGTFLDVGCGHWQRINNTLHFERELGWRGVAIDSDMTRQTGWENNRPGSTFILGDATEIDYGGLLARCHMPYLIDYLSIDLEPPSQNLLALQAVLASRHQFRCVTFEHDSYRGYSIRPDSHDLLTRHGYRFCENRANQDDFWRLDIG